MKKFVFLAHGEMERTQESMEAQKAWWSSMKTHVVDSGNPLFNGRNVSKEGEVTELTPEMGPALGYSIVEAASIEEAIKLLANCPNDMWVYEAMPM